VALKPCADAVIPKAVGNDRPECHADAVQEGGGVDAVDKGGDARLGRCQHPFEPRPWSRPPLADLCISLVLKAYGSFRVLIP